MDRVKELGDASVPFVFDLHALVYTENAPSLEKQLHSRFADQRVNMVNNRKEFFRVPLATVKEALEEIKPDVDFYFDVEAQEFKQTLELQKGESGDESTEARDEIEELKGQFPESI
jgi:thymidylate kinase